MRERSESNGHGEEVAVGAELGMCLAGVPEGPDGLWVTLAKKPTPPEEALVMESEDLLPDFCQRFSLWRNESPS